MVTVHFKEQIAFSADARQALAVFVGEDGAVPGKAQLGAPLHSYLAAAIETAGFSGKATEQLTLIPPKELRLARVIVIGLGASKSLTAQLLEEAGARALAAVPANKTAQLQILAALAKPGKFEAAAVAANLASGARLRAYRFDKYRTKIKPEDKPQLAKITVVTTAAKAAASHYAPLAAVAEAVAFTRDLVSEPANILYPASLAAECRKLSKAGLKVEVLGEAEMKKLGMGSLLGVGQGSTRESQLVVLQWQGGKKTQKPVALIGKGVTFDTGGISIKPAGGMEEMKWDMAGSAAVIGTLLALAKRKAAVNVVGVVGLVENMPDGNAQRPGDVVTSMSGQTIEVLNTDAEGRLVLADALWYCQDRFAPQCMVDLATLTGAIIITLGSHRAGLWSNNERVATGLLGAAERTGEKLWRLPLGPEYDAMINCDIADMKNISDGREAGSTTAAQFLQRFVNDVPWAHLDIAGVAWQNKPITPLAPKGSVGWGVRLLNDWIAKEYE